MKTVNRFQDETPDMTAFRWTRTIAFRSTRPRTTRVLVHYISVGQE